MDKTSAAGYIGASPNSFKIVGEPLGTEEFGFIFKPGSDLVAPVNAAIQSMKDDGTIDKLNQKWFFEYQASAVSIAPRRGSRRIAAGRPAASPDGGRIEDDGCPSSIRVRAGPRRMSTADAAAAPPTPPRDSLLAARRGPPRAFSSPG